MANSLAGGLKPREPRRKVLVKARMRLNGAWGEVYIRDISSRGMLLHGANAPTRGTYIEVSRGRHTVVARVVWASEHRFGAQAQGRINIEAVLGEPDLSALDFKAASLRGPGFERRSSPRTLSPAHQLQLSRSRSSAIQFVVLAGLGMFSATMASEMVTRAFARPLGPIEVSLASKVPDGQPR
jgi:hypothetical protein